MVVQCTFACAPTKDDVFDVHALTLACDET